MVTKSFNNILKAVADMKEIGAGDCKITTDKTKKINTQIPREQFVFYLNHLKNYGENNDTTQYDILTHHGHLSIFETVLEDDTQLYTFYSLPLEAGKQHENTCISCLIDHDDGEMFEVTKTHTITSMVHTLEHNEAKTAVNKLKEVCSNETEKIWDVLHKIIDKIPHEMF